MYKCNKYCVNMSNTLLPLKRPFLFNAEIGKLCAKPPFIPEIVESAYILWLTHCWTGAGIVG